MKRGKERGVGREKREKQGKREKREKRESKRHKKKEKRRKLGLFFQVDLQVFNEICYICTSKSDIEIYLDI